MKSFLPSLRKWKDKTPSPEHTKKGQDLERLHNKARSLDECGENKDKLDSRGYYLSNKTRSCSDDARLHFDSLNIARPSANFPSESSLDSDGLASPDDILDGSLEPLREDSLFIYPRERTARRGILKQSSLQDHSPGSSPNQTEFSEMVDQDDIIALTRHVRSFSDSLNFLRDTFVSDNGVKTPEDIRLYIFQAHQRLRGVLSILKGVLEKYQAINSTEILMSAGIVIKKVKEHNYSSVGEPVGFFEATDQLALAFSSSVSDYLMGDQDVSQNLGTSQSDMGHSFENLKNNETGYDDEEDKRDFLDEGQEFLDSYEYHSERAESEESLERIGYDASKGMPYRIDAQASSTVLEKNEKQADSSVARKEELHNALLSIEGIVDITLQRTKVWSKYAKDIINYMEKRANIESDYCKQLSKLAQTTKPGIVEESYLPFQSTFATSLEDDLNYAANCQKKLQQDLRGTIVKTLTSQRNDHDRIRSKVKERWTKECKKLNDSVINLKKAKSLYIQKQQELEKFVDKQDSKEELNSSSSVVPSFSIGKKKKEEDIAKRAEEAEEYYKKCVDEANNRQKEVERTRESVLLELRDLVYQCDMTMQDITCHFFQLMKSLSAPLRIQYQTLAEDSKQYIVGNQFAEFIKLQQATSKSAAQKRFTFELYVADDKNDFHKGYIGPADYPIAAPHEDQKDSPTAGRRRISTISAGSDTSLNRPSSPANGRRHRNAWGPPNRNSNSDDTGSVSSRSLPGSPSGSPTTNRKDKSQRYSLGQNDLESREILNKDLPVPFRNLKLSQPALTHKFKKLRSSSKCKNCNSYVYFNGADCEHCGLTCHKECLETLAIKCGRSSLPRKMTTFGVDFHKHLDATHRADIPLIMEKCIAETDARCLQVKGIYRLSGVKTKVEVLSQQFESAGEMVDLSNTHPNLITSVLKLYLRELPEPLMTFDLYPTFIQIAKESNGLKFYRKEEDAEEEQDEENDARCEECLRKLHDSVTKLPHANYYTVVRLFKHLRRVANNEVFNQMSVTNLAIIFGPTLLRPRGSPSSLSALMDMTHQARVVELLILNAQILDDDFSMDKKIEEEDESPELEEAGTEEESRESPGINASQSSEKEKEELAQQDSNGNGREELSLSDELQMNYPEMFKRTDSDGRDFSSSLGSLDGMSDLQSPDIEDELKDLIHRTPREPLPNRPINLSIDKQPQRPASPLTVLSAGSESNISFSSLSPVDLPDSSIEANDSNQSEGTETKVESKPEGTETKVESIPESPSPTKMVLEGLQLETIVVREETEKLITPQSTEKNKDILEPSPRRTRRKGDIAIAGDNRKKQYNEIYESVHKQDGLFAGVNSVHVDTTVKDIPEASAPKPDHNVDITDGKRPSSNQSSDFSPNLGNSPSKAPKVPPKPLSPRATLPRDFCPEKFSSESSNEGSASSETTSGDVNSPRSASEDSGKTHARISGNTRKLRDKFCADLLTKNETGKTPPMKEKFPVRQSSFEKEGTELANTREYGRRSSNSTAKLVEKFSRESEKRADRNLPGDGAPLSPKGVSVKTILKHFESGDEMDDDDGDNTSKRKSSSKGTRQEDNDISAYREAATLKHGSSPLPQHRKTHSGEKLDDRIRADYGIKREPKFV